MKKTLSAILAVAMTASVLLTGCGNQNKGNGGEKTTLRVEIFERGDVPAGAGTITDNAMTKWIQENFGEPNNINVEYFSVPRAEEASQLNILMAANEAPDIVLTYSYATMYDYAKKGGLTDLSPYMGNASQLKSFLGEEILKEGQIDEKQYLIPANRLVRGRMAQLVRKDWLDAVDMDVPTTTEEFYQVLKAFKEKDPGNLGDKNIPFGLSMHTPVIEDIIQTFVDPNMSMRDKSCIPHPMRPGYKEGVRFLNKLYNEGLISADFALDKDRGQLYSDIANGYVGFLNDDLGTIIQKGGVYETLKKNNPSASFAAADTWTDGNGNHPKEIYSPVGIYAAVPQASADKAEAAVKYLDWMAGEDVLRTLQYGFEGVTYELDANGIPTVIDSDESKKTHWYTLGFDLAVIVNGKYNPDNEKIIEMAASNSVENQLYKDCFENSIRDGWAPRMLPPDEDDFSAQTALLGEKYSEILVKGIMAAPDKFDEVFDSLIKEYESIGGNEAKERNYKLYDQAYND